MELMKPCIEVEIEECDDIIVDVPLALDLDPDEQPDCCIYRVPEKLHKVNKDAYTPMLISIGPFHHHEKKLKKMEQLKLRYFKEALYRTKKDQKDLAKYIVENEYGETEKKTIKNQKTQKKLIMSKRRRNLG
uniref:Uncharacterized protein n=1 Tax=Quercus lobata TaxID=97700 RepID=A0A7N2LFA7_QUELO